MISQKFLFPADSIYASKINWKYFQYNMFDLNHNEGALFSLDMCCEDCGDGGHQEAKKESWEQHEKGLVEKGQREWEKMTKLGKGKDRGNVKREYKTRERFHLKEWDKIPKEAKTDMWKIESEISRVFLPSSSILCFSLSVRRSQRTGTRFGLFLGADGRMRRQLPSSDCLSNTSIMQISSWYPARQVEAK